MSDTTSQEPTAESLMKADVLWEELATLGYVGAYLSEEHAQFLRDDERVRAFARAVDRMLRWRFGRESA